jgi:hypothetical protein
MKLRNILLLVTGLFTGCSAMRVTHGIPNFEQVSPNVWRGGQPSMEGWDYLKTLGVQRVLKLNEGDEDRMPANSRDMWVTSPAISLERQLGIGNIPLSELEFDADLMEQGGFVHCEHGQDRTGLVVAIYRVRIQGWPVERAEKEMLDHGFHKELIGLWEAWGRFKGRMKS